MQNSSFKKAERKQVKLKLALTGPSGAGKTYSALKIAQGLVPDGRIAMIDTENGSGSLYADVPGMPEYDVIELCPPFTSDRYINLINAASEAGYDVLIIDSISHQWSGEGGILDRKDKEQQAKVGANSYAIWSKYTPEHERFKQAILQAPIHILATMRSKQDYILDTNEKGKAVPKKVGMAPIQREGSEYEYTTVFDLTVEHVATASKDRTGLFDQQFFTPNEETGKQIRKWLISGKADKETWLKKVAERREGLGWNQTQVAELFRDMYGAKRTSKDLDIPEIKALIERMEVEAASFDKAETTGKGMIQ